MLCAGEPELVECDDGQPCQRDGERVIVEQGDAGKRQREQHEFDRHADRRGAGGEQQGPAAQAAFPGDGDPDDSADQASSAFFNSSATTSLISV